MLEHYVVFQARPGRERDLDSALRAFASSIADTLPCLTEFSWGENINPSGRQRGYTHGCHARLTTAAALQEEYWVHPAHQLLLGQLDDLCEDRFALDYVTGDEAEGEVPR